MKRFIVLAVIIVLIVGAYLAYLRLWPYTRLTEPPPLVPVPVDQNSRAPRPAHVIIIVEENKASASVIGDDEAPYINSLARDGAFFANANGVAHPSQPNYLALFTGQVDLNGDECPERGVDPSTPTLGGALLRAHLRFAGYAEDLPSAGFAGCTAGSAKYGYARKHAPWVGFDDVPGADSLPLDRLPRLDALPTVSFIIPDLAHDMHTGTIAAADAWLRAHVGPIVSWSLTHDSLVIITWDESDRPYDNGIPTIFIGQHVKPGRYDERIDHYRVLRTIETMYGLAPIGHSAGVEPIIDCWR